MIWKTLFDKYTWVLIFSVGHDSYTRFWNLQSGELLSSLPPPEAPEMGSLPCVAYSENWAGQSQNAGLLLSQGNSLYFYSSLFDETVSWSRLMYIVFAKICILQYCTCSAMILEMQVLQTKASSCSLMLCFMFSLVVGTLAWKGFVCVVDLISYDDYFYVPGGDIQVKQII